MPILSKKLILALGALALSGAAAAAQWSLAEDFSVTKNRNGQWGYGSAAQLGRFNLMTSVGPIGNFIFDLGGATAWQGPAGTAPNFFPFIGKYFGQPGTTITMYPVGGGISIKQRAGGILMHPGPNGEYAVARWRAKSASSYFVTAVFYSCDGGVGATTSVHVLKNGSSLFTGAVNGQASTAAWMSGTTGVTMAVGDHLDFAVGNGGNGFGNDSTCADVTVRTLDVRDGGGVDPVPVVGDGPL